MAGRSELTIRLRDHVREQGQDSTSLNTQPGQRQITPKWQHVIVLLMAAKTRKPAHTPRASSLRPDIERRGNRHGPDRASNRLNLRAGPAPRPPIAQCKVIGKIPCNVSTTGMQMEKELCVAQSREDERPMLPPLAHLAHQTSCRRRETQSVSAW